MSACLLVYTPRTGPHTGSGRGIYRRSGIPLGVMLCLLFTGWLWLRIWPISLTPWLASQGTVTIATSSSSHWSSFSWPQCPFGTAPSLCGCIWVFPLSVVPGVWLLMNQISMMSLCSPGWPYVQLNLNLTPKTHRVEKENQFPQVVLFTFTHVHAYTNT